MNKNQLASKIWESANKMRSKIEANEYKDYILGFIFYKYLSDKQLKYLKEVLELTEEEITQKISKNNRSEDYNLFLNDIQSKLGYFIEYENLFSTWLEKGRDFDVSDVRFALSAFSRNISSVYKKVFENIFETLETGLSKLGDTSGAQTKAISGLIELIKDIPMDNKQDYDVLGFIYEYLIEKFASNAGKKAGEFYTPHEVSLLMSEIIAEHLKDKEEIKIYDPTSGSGSLLINIGKSAQRYLDGKDKIKYYAQELKENTYNLTRMNLIMRDILPSNIITRNADTLEDDWPYFEENDPSGTYDPLFVDAVVSNPPYSQIWDPSNKESDVRYSNFGLAPRSKADYAFLLHDLYHVNTDGIMNIVLPHGVLFRGGAEGDIRRNLIEANHIDAIIGLPANIFYGTGIPTVIMVLKQNRTNTDILVIDASKGFIKEGKNNKLRASDIKKVVDTIIERKTIDKYSRLVKKEEIRENDYNLNIPRYVDSSQKAESYDIYSSMFGGIPKTEINDLEEYWKVFPSLKKDLFDEVNAGYLKLKDKDIRALIEKNIDVKKFTNSLKSKLGEFKKNITKEILSKETIEDINITVMEGSISDDIFSKLKDFDLINKYDAYQFFSDDWKNISMDLEMIKIDGFNTIKKVDPNIVVKKRNRKDVNVQEGWIGRIIPFDLFQKHLLKDDYETLKLKKEKLDTFPGKYEEILDSLTQEQKDSEILNNANTAFTLTGVRSKIKQIKDDLDDEENKELNKNLKEVLLINEEEKLLKKEIKEKEINLHSQTKEKIESLSDKDALFLLEKKWIDKLIESLFSLPDNLIKKLANKIKHIDEKYEETLFDIEDEIKETELKLADMIYDLTGSDFDMEGLKKFQNILRGIKDE